MLARPGQRCVRLGHRDPCGLCPGPWWRICEEAELSMGSRPWDGSTMDVRRFTLTVFVTLGLAVAPLATPAAAAPPHAAGTMDMSMPADMPCCPDEQKSKDCQDCPLVAMCVLKTAQAGPSTTEALPLRHAIRTAHSFRDDAPAEGLVRPPPDHPPRNLA
jgi:hypothetical protein